MRITTSDDSDKSEATSRIAVQRESLVQLAPWAQPPHDPIPGERDPSTLTHREPGAVSGQFAGGDIPAQPPDWLDRRTAFEHALEGGGDAVKRDPAEADQER